MKIKFLIPAFLICSIIGRAQYQAHIEIDASKFGAKVSPTLHGIFFEEISHAGEGGLCNCRRDGDH